MNASAVRRLVREQPVFLIFLSFILLMLAFKPSFLSQDNVRNVLVDASIYGVSALAMTMAIITGAFDLSLASNFAWAQIFFCYLLNLWGGSALGIFFSFLLMLVSCTLLGCVNGALVVFGRIPPFIATLSTMTAIKGGCLLFTGGNMISTSNPFVISMGRGTLMGLSYLTYVFIAIVILAHFVMRYTRFGRGLYAMGGSYAVAELSGIPVRRNRFAVFALLGLAAGVSGAMFVCLMRAGSVLYGTDLSLTCVAATVVGGTPLSGGKGSVLKTVLGILLIYVLYKGLAFLGLQGYYNTMIRGLVLLAVVSVDAYLTATRRRKR